MPYDCEAKVEKIFKILEGNGSEGVVAKVVRLDEKYKSISRDLEDIKQEQRESSRWTKATFASIIIGVGFIIVKSFLNI